MMNKVLIIGGSFAGLAAARELSQDFQVTLVDLKEYYEYTPGILRSMVEPGNYSSLSVKYSEISQSIGFDFLKGEVIELGAHSAEIHNSQGIIIVTFDFCVISCGSEYYDPIKPHRQFEDLLNERQETLVETHDEIEEAKNIMILGAGIVGVELAAEIAVKFPDKSLTLISSQSTILPGMPALAQQYSQKFLKDRNVKVLVNKTASEEDFKENDLVFKCTGVVYNTKFMVKNFSEDLTERGQILVNLFLQLKEHIFAAGDAAKTTLNLSGTAYVAEEMGRTAAKNIRAMVSGNRLNNIDKLPLVYCISLGPDFGVTVFNSLVIPGALQSYVKMFIQYTKVKEFDNPVFSTIWKALDFMSLILSKII